MRRRRADTNWLKYMFSFPVWQEKTFQLSFALICPQNFYTISFQLKFPWYKPRRCKGSFSCRQTTPRLMEGSERARKTKRKKIAKTSRKPPLFYILIKKLSRNKSMWWRRNRGTQKTKKNQKHTTAGIRWWSPTLLLICRSEACVWQSGRDAHFSSVYGRMC